MHYASLQRSTQGRGMRYCNMVPHETTFVCSWCGFSSRHRVGNLTNQADNQNPYQCKKSDEKKHPFVCTRIEFERALRTSICSLFHPSWSLWCGWTQCECLRIKETFPLKKHPPWWQVRTPIFCWRIAWNANVCKSYKNNCLCLVLNQLSLVWFLYSNHWLFFKVGGRDAYDFVQIL